MNNTSSGNASNWVIALFSTFVGAMLSFVPQYFTSYFQQKNENKQKIVSAYSECERISHLAVSTLKEVNRYKVHKNYFARSMRICEATKDKKGADYNLKRHVESNQENMKAVARFNELNSEYLKNVGIHRMYIGSNDKLEDLIGKIVAYNPPKAAKFDNINNFDTLEVKASDEEFRMNANATEIYQIYKSIDSILACESRNLL